MIRFDLRCTHEHGFEGWFRDNAAYDDQIQSRTLSCPICGDTAVRKAIMAPAIATSRGRGSDRSEVQEREDKRAEGGGATATSEHPNPHQVASAIAVMRAMRAHVRQNFADVGDRFADEARRIHHGEAEHRNIYGRANREQAEALSDEGITFGVLPDVPETDA